MSYNTKKIKKEENASVYKKLRRQYQSCPICPPNKGENAKRKGRHGNKKPKYKSNKRK